MIGVEFHIPHFVLQVTVNVEKKEKQSQNSEIRSSIDHSFKFFQFCSSLLIEVFALGVDERGFCEFSQEVGTF